MKDNGGSAMDELELKIFAAQIRIKIIEMIAAVGKGHVGGSMSIADAMAVLYGNAMRCDLPPTPNGMSGIGWFFPRAIRVPHFTQH